ncbi:MAG TPA: SgcJ/EcaC family oxidoreductase [Gemmatimonadota bacterium]|nr:SgcJ/EcaC family oxidoreductase [Gemmatimonadota bacterium]
MSKLRTVLAPILVALLPLACQTEPAEESGATTEPVVDSAAATEALHQLADQYESTYNARNAAGIAAMYVEDAKWFPPDGPRVEGVGAIQEAMEATYASMPEMSWSLESEEYSVSPAGDMAVGQGTFHQAGVDTTGQSVDQTYQWVAAYRNVDGAWKITGVMWNQGGPAMKSETESDDSTM